MKTLKIKSVYILFALLALILSGNTHASEPLLPTGLVIEERFKPGFGVPVGKVSLVQGNVIIMHADMLRGYRAGKGIPLYEKDTIVTQKKGRAKLKLNDGSSTTLASSTKLKINRSLYDSKNKTRSSFMKLSMGKARFWVRKLLKYKHSSYEVRTPTCVVGVRGSDFIIEASKVLAVVSSLDKETRLSIAGLADPRKITFLGGEEQSRIPKGGLPSRGVRLPPREIERLKKGFKFGPRIPGPGGEIGGDKQKKEEGQQDDSETGDDEGSQESGEPATGGDEGAPAPQPGVTGGVAPGPKITPRPLAPRLPIQLPRPQIPIDMPNDGVGVDVIGGPTITGDIEIEEIVEQIEEIEEVVEEEIEEEIDDEEPEPLPDFPSTPPID